MKASVALGTYLQPCPPATRRSLVRTRLRSMETESFRFLKVSHGGRSRLPWHAHQQPMLVVLERGSYSHMTGERTVACRENDVVFVPANQPHRERIGSDQAQANLILPRIGSASHFGFELPRTLHRFEDGDTDQVAQFLRREMTDGKNTLALESLAHQLLATVSSLAARSGSRPPDWLEWSRCLIEHRFADDLDLSAISVEIGISRSQLSRGFRRWYGCSVWEYLCGVRLEAAARLLRRSRRPIAEIALECGFYDQSHFGNMFRRRFATSPASYRRNAEFDAMRRFS